MPGDKIEFTPEELEKGRQVTEYYENLDVNDPANQPAEDETKTHIFKDMIKPLHEKEDDA